MNPIFTALSALGSGTQGYNSGLMDQLALERARRQAAGEKQQQDASVAYLSALQYLVNPPQDNNPNAFVGAGQPSVPSVPAGNATPGGGNSGAASVSILPVPLSQMVNSSPGPRGPTGAPIPPPPPPAASNANLPMVSQIPQPRQPSATNLGAPASPASAAGIPAAPQQQSNYQNLLAKVVSAVNQAMPNGDPAVKSIVARELMQNVVAQQQAEDQKQAALGLKEAQLGERERNDTAMATIRQQLADAASKNASTRADSSATGSQPTWTPEAIDVAAQAVANGVAISKVAPGLSAKNANRDAIMNRAVKINPNLDIAAAEASFTGRQQEARTEGGIGGRISFAANSLDQSLPLLHDAASKVDLSQFTDLNALRNYARTHTSDPDLEQLMTAIQTTVSDYSSLIARNGVPTDATRADAEALLNKNMGQGSIDGFIKQVEKEKKAQLKAKKLTTGRGENKSSDGDAEPAPGVTHVWNPETQSLDEVGDQQ